jgi:hypothetical protein
MTSSNLKPAVWEIPKHWPSLLPQKAKTPESMFIVNEVTFDIYMILVSIMMKVS